MDFGAKQTPKSHKQRGTQGDHFESKCNPNVTGAARTSQRTERQSGSKQGDFSGRHSENKNKRDKHQKLRNVHITLVQKYAAGGPTRGSYGRHLFRPPKVVGVPSFKSTRKVHSLKDPRSGRLSFFWCPFKTTNSDAQWICMGKKRHPFLVG